MENVIDIVGVAMGAVIGLQIIWISLRAYRRGYTCGMMMFLHWPFKKIRRNDNGYFQQSLCGRCGRKIKRTEGEFLWQAF